MTNIEIKEKVKAAVIECSEIIKNVHNVKAETKSGRRDLVTEYDRRVQDRITAILSAEFPEAGFICEENNLREHINAPLCFIIDPIDGTANFSKNYMHSCISVGCLIDGVPTIGVVYDPFLDEMFTAVKGDGAYLNGERIHITDCNLAESIVIFGTSPYNIELTEITFDRLRRVFNKCLDVRRTGSAALDLCYAACGRCGVFFEAILALWDYAAGVVIVEEAGGICMDMNYRPLDFKTVKTSMIAGSEENVEALKKIFEE